MYPVPVVPPQPIGKKDKKNIKMEEHEMSVERFNKVDDTKRYYRSRDEKI